MKASRALAARIRAPEIGLSVIELLIILAALAVVVLLGVPGGSKLIEHHYLKNASSHLVEGLNLARSEAAKRSSTVRMCPSSNGRFCRSDGNWGMGWLVFTDGNGDGTVQDIELIKSFEAPNEKVRIVARGAAQSSVAFTLTGLQPQKDAQTGEFDICLPESKANSSTILIDSEGWVQLVPDDHNRCQANG